LGPHAELGFWITGVPKPNAPPDVLKRGALKDNGPEDTGGEKDKGAGAAGAGAGAEKVTLEEGDEIDELGEGAEKDKLLEGAEKDELEEGAEKDELEEGAEKDELEEGAEKDELEEGAEKDELEEGEEKLELEEGLERDELEEGDENLVLDDEGLEKLVLVLELDLDDEGLDEVLRLDEGLKERPLDGLEDVLTVILPRCRPPDDLNRCPDTAITATTNINTMEIFMMFLLGT